MFGIARVRPKGLGGPGVVKQAKIVPNALLLHKKWVETKKIDQNVLIFRVRVLMIPTVTPRTPHIRKKYNYNINIITRSINQDCFKQKWHLKHCVSGEYSNPKQLWGPQN